MTSIAPKFQSTIDESTVRLLGRAGNSRGLKPHDVAGRISKAVDKYILRDDPDAGHAQVIEFIDSLHADDLCLIIACERGDENAWGDLVLNFDSAVKSAAWGFCKNREDAEDLAGSIWAELHGLRRDKEGNTKGKLSYYSGKGSLAGWLRAVTNQLAIDEYRKMKRIVQIEEDRQFDNLAQDSAEKTENRIVVSATENPEEILSESEAQTDIMAALQQGIGELEAEEKLIMKMYYIDGLILKEIADTFGYHEATASRKITRIQKKIRKSVEKLLQEQHGWSDSEVAKYLADSAERLGITIEKLFALGFVSLIVQEVLREAVQWVQF